MGRPGFSADDQAKKAHKSGVEKERRERMNASIETLRSLIRPTIKEREKTMPLTKVDKADVLELTVLHLRNRPNAVATGNATAAYEAGYQKCIQETMNFLSAHRLLDDRSMQSLLIHLQAQRSYPGGASTSVGSHRLPSMSTPVRDEAPGTIPFTPYNASTMSPIPFPGYTQPDVRPSYPLQPDMRPSYPHGFQQSMVPQFKLPADVTSADSGNSSTSNSSSDSGISSLSMSSSVSSNTDGKQAAAESGVDDTDDDVNVIDVDNVDDAAPPVQQQLHAGLADQSDMWRPW